MKNVTLLLFLFATLPLLQLNAQTIIPNCQDTIVCLSTNECNASNVSTVFYTEIPNSIVLTCAPTIFYSIDFYDDGLNIMYFGSTNINELNMNFPKGIHRITTSILIMCANDLGTCDRLIEVKDCEAPTVECTPNIDTFYLPSSGHLCLGFNDLTTINAYDNCTDFEDLVFSFSTDINDTISNITCSEVPCDGNIPLQIFVHDENGNLDSCNTYVNIQDLYAPCNSPQPTSLLFNINTYTPNQLNLDIKYQINPTFGNLYIDSFPYCNLSFGDTIEPFDDSPPLNGVTTFDIVLIRKHILGITVFDSPYKELAADVNKSGTITALDIVIIRSLILHIIDEFPNGESWIFDPSYHVVPVGLGVNLDFLGIKLGDVNYTATDWIQNSSTETRTDGTLDFYAKNQNIEQGKTYTIPTFAKDFENISGIQFTIDFDTEALAFQNIQPHNLTNFSNENFGFNQIDEGHILCSWANGIAQNLESDQAIYNITFTAKKDGQLSDFLNINSSQIHSEAYIENEDGFDFKSIELNFEDATAISSEVSIFPNPFSEKTTLTFSLEKEQSVSIQIFDVNARLIISQQSTGSVGENQFEILQADLPISGIYFYRINTEDRILTGRLVLK